MKKGDATEKTRQQSREYICRIMTGETHIPARMAIDGMLNDAQWEKCRICGGYKMREKQGAELKEEK